MYSLLLLGLAAVPALTSPQMGSPMIGRKLQPTADNYIYPTSTSSSTESTAAAAEYPIPLGPTATQHIAMATPVSGPDPTAPVEDDDETYTRLMPGYKGPRLVVRVDPSRPAPIKAYRPQNEELERIREKQRSQLQAHSQMLAQQAKPTLITLEPGVFIEPNAVPILVSDMTIRTAPPDQQD